MSRYFFFFFFFFFFAFTLRVWGPSIFSFFFLFLFFLVEPDNTTCYEALQLSLLQHRNQKIALMPITDTFCKMFTWLLPFFLIAVAAR